MPSFINSPICSRYQILLNSVEFLATSRVVIIVSASTMVLRWSLSTFSVPPTMLLLVKALISSTKFLEPSTLTAKCAVDKLWQVELAQDGSGVGRESARRDEWNWGTFVGCCGYLVPWKLPGICKGDAGNREYRD